MSIAAYISQDLKRRIRAGSTLPTNLSLAELSRHYEVSFTPVRGAIQILVDDGYLRRLWNRRIEVNPAKIGIGGHDEQIARPMSEADWDEILLDEVMHASLSLAAAYLREGALAEKHDVGRSIIRSTFSRFAGAGLLDHVPRRGWRVEPVSIEDVEAYLEVREAMELTALEAARPKIRRSEVLALLDSENRALDDAPHRFLIETSGNRYIIAFFNQFVPRFYRKLLYYAAPEAEVVDEMTSEHKQILQAILDENWSSAREVLSRHIRCQKAVLEKILIAGQRNQWG